MKFFRDCNIEYWDKDYADSFKGGETVVSSTPVELSPDFDELVELMSELRAIEKEISED